MARRGPGIMSPDMDSEYITWKRSQAGTLESLCDKQVWILFSGGKDSSLALQFMLAASKEFNFEFEVLCGTFPRHRYTMSVVSRIDTFWKDRGVKIQWHEVNESDDSLDHDDGPCIVCQQARRRGLYQLISNRSPDLEKLVLITAYTLWDLVSYCLECLTAVEFGKSGAEHRTAGQMRFAEVGQRFYPLLKMKSGLTIYRPVLAYNTQEVVRIIRSASIPILSIPCRYAQLRPKRILETYFESMGLRFDCSQVLRFAESCLNLPSLEEIESMSDERFLTRTF
jgi:tRNA(Ile)-lysidine synthase TilS/MesJ